MKIVPIIRYCTFLAGLLIGLTALAEVQPERPGQVRTLPETYPPHWILVHDVAFLHMLDGRTIVMDADADKLPEQHKGMFSSSLVAQIAQATVRPEIYVAETYYSRGTRGKRTDVVTIYDKRTLAPTDEIDLGDNSRALVLPQNFVVQLIDNERLLLVYNFSPAMSVSVVDVVARKLLNVVALPGCAAVYPTGKRGFSALCGEGALFTVHLEQDGTVKTTNRTEPFFDVDKDALFEKPAWVDGVGYFPSFTGNIRPIDFRADQPVIGDGWSMIDADTGGWRPGGIAISGADANGMIYVLMHPDGGEGSQSAPGMEVWRVDPGKKRRVARHALRVPGLSIALTRDAQSPLLAVTNVEMEIDIYEAASGKFLRTIADFGGETPMLIFGAK
jgi:methylamine dehydrogenase heavy chain